MGVKIFVLFIVLFCQGNAYAQGNQTIVSFSKAKKILEQHIYQNVNRTTIYCNASFDKNKKITLPRGFKTQAFQNRTSKIEWEHIVPAHSFGQFFSQWNNGDKVCFDHKNKTYKGRKCAEKANKQFRLMHADMYNLYPAIGAVNALRKNYPFVVLDQKTPSSFGSCVFKVHNNQAEPPENARGIIARTYKYFEKNYPVFKMNQEQKDLMNKWDNLYPVSKEECIRAIEIEKIQKNQNIFVRQKCMS